MLGVERALSIGRRDTHHPCKDALEKSRSVRRAQVVRDLPQRIDNRRHAGVRPAQQRTPILHRSKNSVGEVLLRARALEKPAIVRNIHQDLCAILNKAPREIPERVFETDQRTDAPVGTTLALIEQGLTVFSAIHGRLHK